MKRALRLSVYLIICLFMLSACVQTPPPDDDIRTYYPDKEKGYTEAMALRLSIADFNYGTEFPYERYTQSGNENWHARSFRYKKPVYSYTPSVQESALEYKSTTSWIDDKEGYNYCVIYGSSTDKGKGTVISDYLMYIPSLDPEDTPMSYGKYPKGYENYLDLSNYEKLKIVFGCLSGNKSRVTFNIYLKKKDSDIKRIFRYSGSGFEKKSIEIDISKEERDSIEFIRFEQEVSADMAHTIENRFYYIEATAAAPKVVRNSVIAGVNVRSEYLGNVLYTKWGAYSASGFYDSEDKKWKLWYGAGIPEWHSSDNIYYIETDDLSKPWSKPKRITTDDSTGYKLIDPDGKLKRHDQAIGYGGDPSVIKIDGTYYMYFSALENGLSDGKYTHWNKIYVATSADGKVWTVQGVPVDCATGGVLGYGAGSPSVVYLNGEFYMYYYTQAPDRRYPDEGTGFVLKKSTDGINFGKGVVVNSSMPACDVKYIPSLRKWVAAYYAEKNQFLPGVLPGIRVGFSDDGVNFDFDHSNDKMVAQNFDYYINHNPGFIGNELGHGYETMFLTYGANDLPLTVDGYWFSPAQYDARQLEWSRITIS